MVANEGEAFPAPLAIHRRSSSCGDRVVQQPVWARCRWSLMARAAASSPSRPAWISWTISVTPASTFPSAGGRRSPVEQTATSMGPVSVPQFDNVAATAPGGGVGVLEGPGPVQAFAQPGVQDDRPQPAGGEHLLAPQHRAWTLTWLRVNTRWRQRGQGLGGNTRARSGAPDFLMPSGGIPAARNQPAR